MKNKRLKYILIVLLVLNAAALASYYFIFQHIKESTQSASALMAAIDEGEQKNSRLNSLRTVIKESESKRGQIAALLLSKEDEIAFIEQIETLGGSGGLQTKTVSVLTETGEKSLTKIFVMQVETTGSWSDTMNFLAKVENLPYDLHVQALTIGEASAGNWSAKFDINVTQSI